jgi:cation diffusion facilitator family transporter
MAVTIHNQQQVSQVLTITLVLNVLVAVCKITLGIVTGALAITADGFHSLTDSAGNITGLVAVRLSGKPADDDHPYGHTKFETVGALFIGVLLLITAWEVITGVFDRLSNPHTPDVTPMTLIVLVGTLLMNIGVSRYQIREGKRLNSTILLTDAQNTSTDVFVTGSVLIGSLVVASTGWLWVDVLLALIVVGFIAKAGYGIIQQTGSVLVDTAPYTFEQLSQVVATIPQVDEVVRARSRGTSDATFIDVDVRVNGQMTVRETTALVQSIRSALTSKFGAVEEIDVHFTASPSYETSH